MTTEERAHLEQRLIRERERTIKALSQFEEFARVAQRTDDGDLTIYPLHIADEGTDTMEREKDFLLASKEGRQLYWIDTALRQIYKEPEKYGKCLECNHDIAIERLDLVPWARLCVSCQRNQEDRSWREAA